jgi:hypothetical protein
MHNEAVGAASPLRFCSLYNGTGSNGGWEGAWIESSSYTIVADRSGVVIRAVLLRSCACFPPAMRPPWNAAASTHGCPPEAPPAGCDQLTTTVFCSRLTLQVK